MDIPAYGSAVLIISDSVRKIIVPTLTSVQESAGTALPKNYSLSQNYPNPFNPSTTIFYQVPINGMVTLKVYDMLGRETATLVNEIQGSGSYTAQFNGRSFSSGMYFYKLSSGSFSETKKMMFVK